MNVKTGIAVAVTIAATLAAGYAVTQYARKLGAENGRRSLERVQLIWPAIRSMPDRDRALIAGLAMTCHVEKRPAVASEVAACLRDAVADPNLQLPKGMDWHTGQVRLNQLLGDAGVQ
ncbi:TPA: hypothetical protein ACK3Q6_007823 [Burkholderia cepacia]|nr:hypothetical protein [Burkholderia cepacia]